ncbi:hypothetical protein [Micromonospora aurantiaca (nom. illeg.)]|uniref:hypothetical protein n=1 Tax=Micromonospora aurantiaca (nom. illeg.) TaxID=47850 RepID=UPI0034096628
MSAGGAASERGEDPVRFVAVDTGSTDPIDKVLTNLIEKADAGAQLVYALFHHPRAKELMTGDLGEIFWSGGMTKAYARATEAYQVGERRRHRETEN